MENDYQDICHMGLCGYLIRVNDDGETVYYRWTSLTGVSPVEHHSKVRYGKNNKPYFLAHGRRVYFEKSGGAQ